MHERGHFKQVLDKLDELINQLDERHRFTGGESSAQEANESGQSERDSLEYLFFKFKYMKAKVLRKTR